jgi:hypothetical protein
MFFAEWPDLAPFYPPIGRLTYPPSACDQRSWRRARPPQSAFASSLLYSSSILGDWAMSETPRGSMSAVESFFHMHDLWTKGHAGQALLASAILDQKLRTAILKKLKPGLSNNKQERIFDGFGPLSEFAAKIEIAYALGQINDEIYGKMRIIKDIRDKFAHSPKESTFFTGEIALLIKKFNFAGKATKPQIFDQMVELCFNHLAEHPTDSG